VKSGFLRAKQADQKPNGLTAWAINIWHVGYQINFTLSPTLPNLWQIKSNKKKKQINNELLEFLEGKKKVLGK